MTLEIAWVFGWPQSVSKTCLVTQACCLTTSGKHQPNEETQYTSKNKNCLTKLTKNVKMQTNVKLSSNSNNSFGILTLQNQPKCN